MPPITRSAQLRRRAPSRRGAVYMNPIEQHTNSRKKALLIGITYGLTSLIEGSSADTTMNKATTLSARESNSPGENKENDSITPLSASSDTTLVDDDSTTRSNKDGVLYVPHNDVLGMKRLLMSQYGYKEDEITIMMDCHHHPLDLQPTRDNIIRSLKEFVKGAHQGDQLFFHYAGHSTQAKCDNLAEEEDGKDEYLVAMDGLHIKDNELRELLVESLPAGTTLTAVFDSCHSATILDLPHTRCNQVYTPWVSKRIPEEEQNITRFVSFSKVQQLWESSVQSSMLSRKENFKLLESFSGPQHRPIGLSGQRKSPLSPSSTSASPSSSLLYIRSPARRRDVAVANLSIRTDRCEDLSPRKEFMSPQSMYRCDGWCTEWDPRATSRGPANVICLSAAKDSQKTWESRNDSMTQSLIRILYKNPHPNLQILLELLGGEVHKFYLELHSVCQQKIEKWEREHPGKKLPEKYLERVETENFQDPQISSLKPLNMKEHQWNP